MSAGAAALLCSSFRRKPESSVFCVSLARRARNWIPACAGMTSFVAAAVLFFSAPWLAHAAAAERILDDFEDLKPWTAQHTDDVSATLHGIDGKLGKALRLDFDFRGANGEPINGYATARRALPLDLPDNYELSFWIRGEAGVNTLQFKLADASGENVWWINRPDFAFPHDWQQIRIKKRQIEFAWGPTSDRALKRSASIEFVVSSGRDGGAGSVYFDELAIRALPPADTSPLTPLRVSASSALAGAPAAAAVDADPATAWRCNAQDAAPQTFDLDFGKPREFGGLVLHWLRGAAPGSVAVQTSDDGHDWRPLEAPRVRSGSDDALLLTETQARRLRLVLGGAGHGGGCALAALEVKDLAWGASPNAFFGNLARTAPRGAYPRGFVEQPYWTIVGVDGGPMPALLSEDGAVQPGQAGFSIEPFVRVAGKLISWADVTPTQSLRDGYLPIPSIAWRRGDLQLTITAFADGERDRSHLVVSYEARNDGAEPLRADLALAIRPFQVNPPAQFLNTAGGVAPIHDIAWQDGGVAVGGRTNVVPLDPPDDFVVGTLADGSIAERIEAAFGKLRDGEDDEDEQPLRAPFVHDASGYASAAMVYRLDVPAHGRKRVSIVTALTGVLPQPVSDTAGWVDARLAAVTAAWQAKLDRVRIRVPAPAQRIVDALRTAHAHMLLSRDGAALRPGTRSYARSWIRDGAMIGDALLRLGDIEPAREYVDWYAPHQFGSGKVPCCVDHRGSDPVPENDSHGELIHAIAQLYRYGGDLAQLEKNWPHVEAAIGYMDTLRASQTGTDNAAFKGLMPASISHEGYSAKPMHSYWDDFWALTGYKDAADMAAALGKTEAAARIGKARDEFAADVRASIAAAVQQRGIDFIPGSAELGDFDATSTTIAFAPAGESGQLPQDLLRNTFERYWRGFAARADGSAPWNDYTPYEWRTVGSFVRLGQRERAQAAIDFFFASGARPLGWNQWGEVVRRDPRQPGFIGDMPHAWVASDFIRSALDLFAYERADDKALVLAAGIPADWLDGDGIAVEHLRTAHGELSYSLRRDGKELLLHVAGGCAPPGGFAFVGPMAQVSGTATVNHEHVEWKDGEVHFGAAPADIAIEE